ncbi:MAG: recombinase family protein [Acidiferrobacterales bacterium]
MEPNKRATTYFLYARKSSESEDRQVQSIDDQLNRLTQLARDLHLQVTQVYTEARSAKKPDNRPLFSEMLRRIEKGDADGILCWQINRLSRNPIDSGRLGWMLQQGILRSIQTIDRQYLPDDNVLLFSVESGMANQFIIDLKKNISRGLEGKIGRGWRPSHVPLGYLNDKNNRTIVKDPERFALVRKMWDLMLTGSYTPPQIRTIANKEWGFRTPAHKRGGGAELSNSVIYRIFANIFYTGLFEWRGRQYPGKHEFMVTLDEYDRVQTLLGRKGRPRPQSHRFAFTGIFRCGECGAMHTAEEKTKLIKTTGKIKTYVYYHCTRRKKGVECSQRNTLTVRELERQIEKEIEKYTILPEFKDWALRDVSERHDRAIADRAQIHATRQKSLVETQNALDNLMRMRYRDLIDDETFLRERNTLTNTLTQLKARLQESAGPSDRQMDLDERSFNFATYAHVSFLTGTPEEKKEILVALGQNQTIKDKKLSIEASDWLVPIGKKYPELEAEYKRLELTKNPLTATQKEVLASIRLRWCSVVEEVRTAIHDGVYVNIPIISPPPTPGHFPTSS